MIIKMKTMKNYVSLYAIASLMFLLGACVEDEATMAPKARFTHEADADNYLMISFENESVDAETYAWDFGDGSTSNEESPVHTYAEVGMYKVVLTITGGDVTDSRSEDIQVADPLAAQRALIGEGSKTWKLLRDVSGGAYTYLVGPEDRSGVWWSFGKGTWTSQPLCERPCSFDDTFTFNADGTMTRDVGVEFWAEWGVWAEDKVGCFDVTDAAAWMNKDGVDVSAWGNGTFDYTYDSDDQSLVVTGNGAYVGFAKLGSDAEYIVPQSDVEYKVVKLVDADVDTLVLETVIAGGYWNVTLVSYDEATAEPAVSECEEVDPNAGDLEDATPTALFNTFASAEANDVNLLVSTTSDVTLTIGEDDPADASAAKVGKYVRGTKSFADLKFQMANDIQFDNFTTVSLEVYFPSSNTYEGGLNQKVDMFFADASQDAEFWNTWTLLSDETITAKDQWVTVTFDLTDVKARQDIDLVGLKIGSDNHAVDGTFYIRNFEFK